MNYVTKVIIEKCCSFFVILNQFIFLIINLLQLNIFFWNYLIFTAFQSFLFSTIFFTFRFEYLASLFFLVNWYMRFSVYYIHFCHLSICFLEIISQVWSDLDGLLIFLLVESTWFARINFRGAVEFKTVRRASWNTFKILPFLETLVWFNFVRNCSWRISLL